MRETPEQIAWRIQGIEKAMQSEFEKRRRLGLPLLYGDPGFNSHTMEPSVRKAIEEHFRSLGYRVYRRHQFQNGSRVEGLFIAPAAERRKP